MHRIPAQPTAKGPAEWFTGDVYIDAILRGADPVEVSVAAVHFTPGARSAWHSHGTGQTLWVTDGHGLIQTRGEDIVEIRAGDVVTTPPDEEHWHGATPHHHMTHVSITRTVPGRPDNWAAHVTDSEYPSEGG
jgi:quercetin dioxygenase-like cupin family protein